MQRSGRAVVADIGGDPALAGRLVQPLEIGGLMDEAPLGGTLRNSDFGALIASLVDLG